MNIKIVGKDKDIKITDNIRFLLSTTDSNGCAKTPYKVNKATIYFISREFAETSVNEYSNNIYDPKLLKKYEEQKSIACNSPTDENLNKLNIIKNQLENSKFSSPFFFKEAMPIKIFGGYVDPKMGVAETFEDPNGSNFIDTPPYQAEIFPVWLNPDLVPIEVKEKVEKDNILNLVEEGSFTLDWNPVGCREGDYFICWNWTPNVAGDSISSHMMFSLGSDTRMTASIPTHYTKKDKYQILMEKYLPEMFKNILSESDLSPYVLQELNFSVAEGFTFLEDMANQIIDLLDANSVHEQLLPLLSNTFNLKLKSGDPTLWRRQAKKAISNFKRKGTITGLKSALSDSGMAFLKLTRLWQVISKYTYQEHFVKTNESNKFTLTKNIVLPIVYDENGDPLNIELYLRPKNSNDWQKIDLDNINFIEENFRSKLVWNENEEISFEIGDSIRILYPILYVPNETEQNIESYIQKYLKLMDQRDERLQKYPLKNWNTRLIEEDDPLFDIIIPVRHPIQDPVIWGKVRTEFPYSENIYNMEEYNGSTRDSTNPCDINKDFLDPCKDCQASTFSIDIEIENLSNDRLSEAEDVIREFVPFHSAIHSMNFIGSRNEFVKSPLEELNALISFHEEDNLISGEAQHIFTRSVARSDHNLIKRNMLANVEDKTGNQSGTGFNKSILLYCPSFSQKSDLENQLLSNKSNVYPNKNISTNFIDGTPFENSNLLEILSPSANAGCYSVSEVGQNHMKLISQGVYSVAEPLNKSQFEFRVSNKISQQTVNISQSDLMNFKSEEFDFSKLKIITQKDVEDNTYTGQVWRIRLDDNESFEYEIKEILPNNSLILDGPNFDEFSLQTSEISWKLIDPSQEPNKKIIDYGDEGLIKFRKRGLVDFSVSTPLFDIRNKIKLNDYILYNDNQYKVISFDKQDEYKLYIDNYDQGNVGGVDTIVYRRIIKNCVGQLDYSGLVLETQVNYETDLGIQNGSNYTGIITKNNNFKENYLILINSNYYSILDINGSTITLDGPNNDWTTLGTPVDFTIYKFIKQSLEIPESNYPKIPGHNFNQIGRENIEVIENQIAMISPLITNKILNSSGSEFVDSSGQIESISYKIEYKKEEE